MKKKQQKTNMHLLNLAYLFEVIQVLIFLCLKHVGVLFLPLT